MHTRMSMTKRRACCPGAMRMGLGDVPHVNDAVLRKSLSTTYAPVIAEAKNAGVSAGSLRRNRRLLS